MLDPVQKFLMQSTGKLNSLQAIDLTSHSPDSAEATQLLQEFISAAKMGDVYSMTICASCYRSGWGVAQNGEKAFEWAKKAAGTGFPPGLAELGYCYEEGFGVEKNLELAWDAQSKAANQGYSMAAINLAIQYASGTNYKRSEKEAVRYAEIAFQLGDAYAAYLIGAWYEEGLMFDKNEAIALLWYEKAANLGSRLACLRLATANLNGELGLASNSENFQKFWKASESSISY